MLEVIVAVNLFGNPDQSAVSQGCAYGLTLGTIGHRRPEAAMGARGLQSRLAELASAV